MYSHLQHDRRRGKCHHQFHRGHSGWVQGDHGKVNLGPILKGPKMNRIWERTSVGEDADNETCEESVGHMDSGDANDEHVNQSQLAGVDKVGRHTTSGVEAHTSDVFPSRMKKVGTNKLVLKSHAKTENGGATGTKNIQSTGVASNFGKRKPPEKGDGHLSFDRLHKPAPDKWKRVGSHKLVLKSSPGDTSSVTFVDRDDQGMKARGRNKLVSDSRLQEESALKEALKRKRMESKFAQAQGRSTRIKLSENERDDSGTGKLTDYAYQKTCRQSRRNMGLVRVGAVDAPICPTFMLGIACTNVKCKKRHDVPIEAATPICSFFQRHGQCKKRETCPFRHIKVSRFAMICPSFSLLGYCEDKDCEMKHVRQPKEAIK